jgi:cobalt-precorrin 5A hydrolase/precorrin-3B C17-methyltransferase
MKNNNPKPKTSGLLSLVSLGPGDLRHMTSAAQTAIQSAEVVIGYQVYIEFVQSLLNPAQEVIDSPIGREVERARHAIELAAQGRRVALISSGDIGIYAMASPVFELLPQWDNPPPVEVYPGVSAIQAAAAKLGAPLGHDFCAISLSDLLTPWPIIERRIKAAAWGDFVIGFYNPRSQKRDWQLEWAIEILRDYRSPETPAAIVQNVTRPDEQIKLTTLAEFDATPVDMFTLVLVGNSQSFVRGQWLVTPRGYRSAEEQRSRGRQAEGQRSRGAEEHSFGYKQESDLSHSSLVIRHSSFVTHHSSLITASRHSPGYPITLTQLAGAKAVVVGGGPVGERKMRGLLEAGASARLISPEATPQLQTWANEGRIEWLRRPYQPGDLAEARLVFAATNQRQVNAQVAVEARQLGLLCNVSDQPAEGDFHVPAVHRQPGLMVAVSTNGESPRRAQQIRNKIARWLNLAQRISRDDTVKRKT